MFWGNIVIIIRNTNYRKSNLAGIYRHNGRKNTNSFLDNHNVAIRPTIYTPYQKMTSDMSIDEIENYNRKTFYAKVPEVSNAQLLQLVYYPNKYKEILNVKE